MSNYYNRQWRLPNAWNGTESNVNKQSNYSLSFDGSSQINSSSNLGISGASQRTFSAWIKTTDAGGGWDVIVATGNSGNAGNNFELDYRNSVIIWERWGLSVYGSVTVNDGNWHHACITYDGNVLKLYVDGSEDTGGDFPYTIGATTSTDTPVRIGGMNHNSKYFNGQIDGVAIFDYVLSTSQVTTLYGSSSTGIGNPMSLSPKPVFYAPLGDQDAFNGSNYLVPNSSLKDYVFDFNGTISSAKYVSLTTTTLPSGNSSFTMSVWLNRDTSVPSYGGVLSFGDIGSTNGLSMAYINFNTTNQIKYGFYGGDAGTTSIDENVWHHVVLTYDGTNATFYINKQSITNSQPGTLLIPSTSVVKIGGLNTSSQNFNGKISNAQIFNTALPATGSNSIETLYNNGSPLTSMSGFTSLVGWWKLDASATYDGTDWTIPDDSSNSNDGTSSGMTQANLVQSDLSFTSGYSPYALSFDGAGDSMDLGVTSTNMGFNVNQYNTLDNFSISCWFRWDGGTISGSKTLVTWWKVGGQTYVDGFLGLTTGNMVRFGDNWQTAYIFSYIPDTWHHIVAIKTTNNAYIYINGNLASTKGSSLEFGFNNYCRIGGGQGGGEYWNGALSNISLWQTNLTSAQVSEIYNEGKPSNLNNHSAYSNLTSWWQLGSNMSFNGTDWVALNEGSTKQNAESNYMSEDMIVDGVRSYANGLSSGMGGDEVIGDAPYSTANALSVNMDILDRTTDVPS